MRGVRIKGVVGFTERVRRELSAPLSEDRRSALRSEVADVIREVDRIVARHGTSVARLPSPTRRAYQFLTRLDLDNVATASGAAGTAPPWSPSGSVRLIGISSFWDSVLHRLAVAASAQEREEVFGSIHRASERTSRYMRDEGIALGELTPQSCSAYGWLTFFARREHFDAYVAAVDRARPAFEAGVRRSPGFAVPVLLEFRPMAGLYRVRGYRDRTRISMPVPMITFSSSLFARVAEAVLAGGDKQAVMAATAKDAYQYIQSELDTLTGVEDNIAGSHHDLGASFDRVNAQYFEGRLPRPRLTWSRTFTGRKYGHYNQIRDTVMISCSLDQAMVPEYALDFVVYHELLHKKLSVQWQNGRANAHTPEFRRLERQFNRYAEADNVLKRLAAGRMP